MTTSTNLKSDRLPAHDDRHAATQCPNCLGHGVRSIYSVDGIPAHSVLLMPDRESATEYPRGDMRLGFCDRCGFLTNTAFNVTLNEYTTDYEETQLFSLGSIS